MTFIHILIIALVQGITEFLPISSSGHLILIPFFMGKQDHGLMMDVAAHAGSLLAVMIYFRQEVWQLILGFLDTLRHRQTRNQFLFMIVVMATIPGLVIGGLLHFYASELFRHVWIIAFTSAFFGLALWWYDAKSDNAKSFGQMTIKHALIIGCAQILAFIPGTSRSGVTMTAARGLGFDRETSARFSMFLAMPIIGAATCIYLLTMVNNGYVMTMGRDFFIVAGLSFAASILAIHGLLQWLKSHSFKIFALYRLALSIVIILLLF